MKNVRINWETVKKNIFNIIKIVIIIIIAFQIMMVKLRMRVELTELKAIARYCDVNKSLIHYAESRIKLLEFDNKVNTNNINTLFNNGEILDSNLGIFRDFITNSIISLYNNDEILENKFNVLNDHITTLNNKTSADVVISELDTQSREISKTKSNDLVTVKNWRWSISGKGEYKKIVIEGLVCNTTKSDVSFLEAKVDFFDSKGRYITSNTGYTKPSKLKAGQTATFKVVKYIESSNTMMKKVKLSFISDSKQIPSKSKKEFLNVRVK